MRPFINTTCHIISALMNLILLHLRLIMFIALLLELVNGIDPSSLDLPKHMQVRELLHQRVLL